MGTCGDLVQDLVDVFFEECGGLDEGFGGPSAVAQLHQTRASSRTRQRQHQLEVIQQIEQLLLLHLSLLELLMPPVAYL